VPLKYVGVRWRKTDRKKGKKGFPQDWNQQRKAMNLLTLRGGGGKGKKARGNEKKLKRQTKLEKKNNGPSFQRQLMGHEKKLVAWAK